MAIYSFDMKTVSFGAGQSAVAAAAYIMRDRRLDERTGLIYDFSRDAADVLAHGIVGVVDWQAAHRAERRRDAVVARTIILALPHELDLPAKIRTVEVFVSGLRHDHGISGEWVIQGPPVKDGGDPRNGHAHIQISARRVDETGKYGEKTKELDDRRTGSLTIKRWREQWQDAVNLALAENGRSERVDCRSLKDRGIERPPRKHLGPAATAQVRKGLLPSAATHNKLVDEWEKTAAEEAQAHDDYEQLRDTFRREIAAGLERAVRAADDADRELAAATLGAEIAHRLCFSAGVIAGCTACSHAEDRRAVDADYGKSVPRSVHRAKSATASANSTHGRRGEQRNGSRSDDTGQRAGGVGGGLREIARGGTGSQEPEDHPKQVMPIPVMPATPRTEPAKSASPTDSLFDVAKRLDLTAIACDELGFEPHSEKDTERWRLLVHQDGTRLLLWKVEATGHWLWRPTDDPDHRPQTIFELLAERRALTRGQTLAQARRWNKHPLPSVPVRGDHTRNTNHPVSCSSARRGLEDFGPVTEPRWFRDRHIGDDVLAAYGHAIFQHPLSLAIVFPHGRTPGEIRNFREGQKAATGAQMSIWEAEPRGLPPTPIVRVVIAESAPRCLAWAQAHPDLRAGTLLVSTAGGNVSAAGRIALHELLTQTHPYALICDAYDGANDPVGEKASTRLKTEFGEARYRDYKPRTGVKDWEKELVRSASVKSQQIFNEIESLGADLAEPSVTEGHRL